MSEYRYWAFISYSSKDESWARWLHSAIESYGIPTRLIGHLTPAGEPAPKRFQPLFHDRAELPASADLAAPIEEALRASRYLIVICSPNAAQSKWVDKEVETFRSSGRPERLLALIVDGEPHAGDARECFPPALRQAEPIAADARPQGDGKRDAKLKLLAGMLGVGFDALKQRDSQRRIRRLQVAVAAFVALVFSFAGLALFAESQRKAAVKARNQAENILQFLLYDLRDKLEPVGRLDILRDVHKRVDSYYRELGVDAQNPMTLRNRWAAHVNSGDRLREEGNLPAALGEFRSSLEIAERLARQDPGNAAWQRELEVAHERIGYVLVTQGDAAGALLAYRRSLAIAEAQAARDPTDTDRQRSLSVSHNRTGDVLAAQGDRPGALQAYRKSLAIFEALAARDPANTGWQRDLSVSHNKIGDVLVAQGDRAGALQAYRKSLTIAEALAASDPANTGWQRGLSVSHERIGNMLLAQGDGVGAVQAYRKSLANAQALAARDPINAGWQRDLMVSYTRLAEATERSDSMAAKEWWRKAHAQLANMKERGLMSPSDERALDYLWNKAVGSTSSASSAK